MRSGCPRHPTTAARRQGLRTRVTHTTPTTTARKGRTEAGPAGGLVAWAQPSPGSRPGRARTRSVGPCPARATPGPGSGGGGAIGRGG
ncbi:hypothetical protein GCM10023259_048950 [Thermocatellispora tengchongensis]